MLSGLDSRDVGWRRMKRKGRAGLSRVEGNWLFGLHVPGNQNKKDMVVFRSHFLYYMCTDRQRVSFHSIPAVLETESLR